MCTFWHYHYSAPDRCLILYVAYDAFVDAIRARYCDNFFWQKRNSISTAFSWSVKNFFWCLGWLAIALEGAEHLGSILGWFSPSKTLATGTTWWAGKIHKRMRPQIPNCKFAREYCDPFQCIKCLNTLKSRPSTIQVSKHLKNCKSCSQLVPRQITKGILKKKILQSGTQWQSVIMHWSRAEYDSQLSIIRGGARQPGWGRILTIPSMVRLCPISLYWPVAH